MRLCRLDAIDDGAARGFDPLGRGRDSFFVVRRGDGFVAYDNACPHPGYEGSPLPWRRNAYLDYQGERIVCSGHGARFALDSGCCVAGPCAGKALQRARVRLGDDGYLYWNVNDEREH